MAMVAATTRLCTLSSLIVILSEAKDLHVLRPFDISVAASR
jgi:hypothetical protein